MIVVIAILIVRPDDPGPSAGMDPSGPPAATDAAVSTLGPGALGGAALPVDAASLVAGAFVATIDPSQTGGNAWLVGPLGGPWTRLDINAGNAEVGDDWGRFVATRSDGEGVVVERIDPSSGARKEIYRSLDGGSATVRAALSRDESLLFVFGVDIGLRSVRLADGKLDQLVKPFSGPPGSPVQRGDIAWSPTGSTVSSKLCTSLTCRVDVVDIASMTVRSFDGFVGAAVSDQYVVGYRSEEDRGWASLDLGSGVVSPIASMVGSPYDAIALTDTTFLLYGALTRADQLLHFTVVDLDAGTERLVHQDLMGQSRLYEVWQSPTWALIGGRDGLTGAIRAGEIWSVLDLRDGTLLRDTVPIQQLPGG
ncbi:MAG: hypothetical protein V4515_02755 [Chloroflexota bacterium]